MEQAYLLQEGAQAKPDIITGHVEDLRLEASQDVSWVCVRLYRGKLLHYDNMELWHCDAKIIQSRDESSATYQTGNTKLKSVTLRNFYVMTRR